MIAFILVSIILPSVELGILLAILTAIGEALLGAYLYRRLRILSDLPPGKKGWY